MPLEKTCVKLKFRLFGDAKLVIFFGGSKLHADIVDPEFHAELTFVGHSAAGRTHQNHVGRRCVGAVPALFLNGNELAFGVLGVVGVFAVEQLHVTLIAGLGRGVAVGNGNAVAGLPVAVAE